MGDNLESPKYTDSPSAHRVSLQDPDISTVKNKAVKGAGINILAQSISLIVHMGGVVILARLLRPDDFGLVTMVTAFSLLVMNFGINGFTEYIIQKKTLSHAELSTIFWLYTAIGVVLTLLFIIASPLLAMFYDEPKIISIAIVMAFGITIQAISAQHLALLKRNMEFKRLAINQLMGEVLSVLLAIGMAVLGMGYWAIAARQLSANVAIAAGAWVMSPWRPGLYLEKRKIGRILKYVINVYGNFTLGYFARNIDKVLLGRFLGSQVLGTYDRAYHLSSMPAEQLVTPLHSVALASLSRFRDDPERYSLYFNKALRVLAFIGALASLILTMTGNDLIFVLLGPGWEVSGHIVTAFGPGVAGMLICSTSSWLHLSLGRPDRWLRWNLMTFSLTVVGVAVAAYYSAIAVAAVYSISFNLMMIPSIWYAGKPIKLRITPILVNLWPFIGSAILIWFIWWILEFKVGILSSGLFFSIGHISRVCTLILINSIAYICFVSIFEGNFSAVQTIVSLATTIFMRNVDDKDVLSK
jgi:O-antigen/teichoic acid export membrane protein